MKKTLVVTLVLALVVGAFSASAGAKKKKAKPVATKLYLHGVTEVGENDSFLVVNDTYLPMDTAEPSGTTPKSRLITNYLVGPNAMCAGNNLFPVWSGKVAGRIKGDMKVIFSAIGTPGPVEIRVWPDVMASACDSENPVASSDAYPDPAGAVTVDLPPGEGTVEAVIEDVDFTAAATITLQFSPVVAVDLPSPAGSILNPFVSRIVYDTADFASSIEFSCTPTAGKTCS